MKRDKPIILSFLFAIMIDIFIILFYEIDSWVRYIFGVIGFFLIGWFVGGYFIKSDEQKNN